MARETDRESFEWLVKETRKENERQGNTDKVTEQQIREHCQKIADRVDAKRNRNIKE
jgi:hypothetical protein